MALSLHELRCVPSHGRGALYENIDLRLEAGECCCILGATGVGKSTLLRHVAGLELFGSSGEVRIHGTGGQEGTGRVGLILQNPETQFLCPDVGSELAFGLENLCLPPAGMEGRMRRALERVGLDVALSTPVRHLSMGQKYKLLLACFLVMDPDLLLLDEPCAQLDADGIAALAGMLTEFLGAGACVLMCEHEPGPLARLATSIHELRDGGLRAAAAPARPRVAPPDWRPDGKTVVEVRGVSLRRGTRTLWSGLDLSVRAGEIMLLCGPNGCGKSTLLRVLTGFQAVHGGEVRVFGASPRPAALRGRLGILHQNPGRQLTADTVAEEVGFALRQRRISAPDRAGRVAAWLDRLGLGAFAERSPFQLSYGEQHLTALASVLAVEPEVLLLDDPLAGLDAPSVERMWTVLQNVARRGTAIVCAMHREPESHGAHRAYFLDAGGVGDV